MALEPFPDLSPEQVYAHKVAVQELAKYYEEFSRWRKAKRAFTASDKPFQVQASPRPDIKEPAPPARPSAG